MNNVLEQVKTIIDEELKAIDISKEKSKSDKNVRKERFDLASLSTKVLPILRQDSQILSKCLELSRLLTEKQVTTSLTDIFRFSFFVQLVWKKGGSANYATRWSEHFNLPDPRHNTYKDCIDIFIKILSDFVTVLSTDDNKVNFIHLRQKRSKFYWIDYQQKNINNSSIHDAKNINIISFDNPSILKILKLEKFLLTKTKNSQYYKLFQKIYNKVRTKAYLTDRGQTGGYQTNRELRWEAHPDSIEFAFVRNCQEIEYKLVKQILEFKGFPIDIIQGLEEEKVIGKGEITPESYKCPITMEHLLFSDFQDELLNRTHGESKFQVGHIVPRKAKSASDFQIQSGENICWISSEGNEIQQNRSVDETRELLKKIFNNYKDNNLLGVTDFRYDFYLVAIAKLLNEQYFRLLDFYFHTLIQ